MHPHLPAWLTRERPARVPPDPTQLVPRLRTTGMWILGGTAVAATIGAGAESANGVYHWALAHHLAEWRAVMLPGFVDTFFVMGEVALFLLMFWAHRWWHRIGAWCSVLAGLAASVAANGGDAWRYGWVTRITWALAPVAAAAALAIALSVLKRIIEHARAGPARTAASAPARTATPAPPRTRKRTGPRTVPDAAAEAYRASVEAGRPLSQRDLAARPDVPSVRQARNVIAAVKAAGNGQAAHR